MSKSAKGRAAKARPASVLDAATLAGYRSVSRVPTSRDDLGELRRLVEDYDTLFATGDLMRALGAGMALVDVALRIATTPSLTAADWTFKQEFIERHLEAMAKKLDHPHVARAAAAALAAERTLPEHHAKVRH